MDSKRVIGSSSEGESGGVVGVFWVRLAGEDEGRGECCDDGDFWGDEWLDPEELKLLLLVPAVIARAIIQSFLCFRVIDQALE